MTDHRPLVHHQKTLSGTGRCIRTASVSEPYPGVAGPAPIFLTASVSEPDLARLGPLAEFTLSAANGLAVRITVDNRDAMVAVRKRPCEVWP